VVACPAVRVLRAFPPRWRSRALVVELWEANAGLREVIAAQEERIAELERRRGKDCSTRTSRRPWTRLPQADAAVVA
jgi:hypothetical protein